MMVYGARQLRNDDGTPSGKWHYTAKNSRGVFPVGYCADGCPGHSSDEEAIEHYIQYLLDNAELTSDWDWNACCMCGDPTRLTIWFKDDYAIDICKSCDSPKVRKEKLYRRYGVVK